MKKAKKFFRDSFKYAPQMLVLFSVLISNVFFPALAIAQEITDLVEGNNEVEVVVDTPLDVVVDIPLDEPDILKEGISTSIYEEERGEEKSEEEEIVDEAIAEIEEDIPVQEIQKPEKENPIKKVWAFNGSTSTTTLPIALNWKYVSPQNENVTVTFTKLPDNPGHLTIEEIVLNDNEVIVTNAVSRLAYDITTDMEDGTFEYDLTLPDYEDGVRVLYAENRNLLLESIKEVEEEIVNENGSIKIERLNHFTLFIPSTGGKIRVSGSLGGQTQVTVNSGQSIRVDLVVGGNSGDIWKSTSWQIQGESVNCIDNEDISVSNTSADYSFDITAPSTENTYDVSFVAYTNDTCDSGASNTFTLTDGIIVDDGFTPPNVALEYNANDPIALSSVTGIWTSVTGGSNITGVNTNEVKWGSGTFGKSGLRFDSSGLQSFDAGENFYLGALTHLNYPITNAANGATLKITLEFEKPNVTPNPEFSFYFDIDETNNTDAWGRPLPVEECPAWQKSNTPCDDRITFPSIDEEASFAIGDKLYTLKIEGFVDSYPSGVPVSSFITEEHENNTAFLVGSLSSILVERPDIRITKKTNEQNIEAAPGDNLYVGDPVTWQYVVQNTGNVELTNISVTDNPTANIDCDSVTEGYQNTGLTLAAGASMTCTASGIVQSGQFTNTATVTGTPPTGPNVTASDTSWYYGINKSTLTVQKITIPSQDTTEFDIDISTINGVIFGDTSGKISDSAGKTYSLSAGTYSVSETTPEGWSETGNTCQNVIVGVEDTKTCTITNTKYVPVIQVVKSSTTTEITYAGQIVPYVFTVTNEGNQTLTGVTVEDDKCDTAPIYNSGDDGDNKLQTNETWIYNCSHTVTQAEMDTGGNLSNNVTVDSVESPSDTDTKDIPITQTPAINVVKSSTTESITTAGQVVPYTFTVSNEGNLTLSEITVVDELCDANPLYESGDTNADEKLQPTEVWIYKCNRTINQSDIENSGEDREIKNTVTVDSKESVEAIDDHNIPITLYDIHGFKWDDINGNGERDCMIPGDRILEPSRATKASTCDLEPLIEDWTINLYKWNGEGFNIEPLLTVDTADTDEDYGWYWFEDLLPGRYKVCEVQEDRWLQTFPINEDQNCHIINLPDANPNGYPEMINATPEPAPTYNFGNYELSTLIVRKVVLGKDHMGSLGDEIYSDDIFQVYLEGSEDIKDIRDNEEEIIATFDNLGPETHTLAEMPVQDGYSFAGCFPMGITPEEFYSNRERTEYNPLAPEIKLNSGEELTYICYNDTIRPQLNIFKSNDTGGTDMHPGDIVTYTIIVSAPNDSEDGGTYLLNNVKVVDLIPDGFEYVLGSATGVLNTPEYKDNMPAIWEVGDMKEGDIITLTYQVTISETQDPGTYKDIAYTYGDSLLGVEDVLGSSTINPGTPFVGTEVIVVEEPELKEGEVLGTAIELEKEVLGAATELPKTGASTYLTLGALITMITGFLLLLVSPKKKIANLVLAGALLLGISTLAKPQAIHAANPLINVQIEQPESPTDKTNFKIGYVALAIPVSTDLEIQCYEETSGLFGPVHTTKSGSCIVDETIITDSGTYKFYVIASTNGTTKQSNKVTIEVDLNKPGVVTEYNKDKSICSYSLKFITANDGRTSKVQIFRSDKQPFTANASTLIETIAVLPYEQTTYTDNSLPDCDKEYYYAVRALDNLNNSSSFVTDNIVTVLEKEVTIAGATTVGTAATGATTAGASTTEVISKTETGETVDAENGEVAGEETDIKEESAEKDEITKDQKNEEEKTFWEKYWFVIIASGSILLIMLGYAYARKRK